MGSISSIIAESYRVIVKDPIVLAPSLLYSLLLFMATHIKSISSDNISYLMGISIVQLFFLGLTIVMVIVIHGDKLLVLRDVVIRVMLSYVHLLVLHTITTIIPTVVFFYVLPLNQKGVLLESESTLILGMVFFISILFFFLNLYLMFAPVIVLLNNEPWQVALRKSFNFVKAKTMPVLWLLLLVLGINIIVLFFVSIVSMIPILGSTVIANLCEGLGFGFVTVLSVMFFLKNQNASTIDIKA